MYIIYYTHNSFTVLYHAYYSNEKTFKWTSEVNSIEILPFSHHVGPTVDIPSSPLEIFFLFFTSTFIEYICRKVKYVCCCVYG